MYCRRGFLFHIRRGKNERPSLQKSAYVSPLLNKIKILFVICYIYQGSLSFGALQALFIFIRNTISAALSNMIGSHT